MATLKIAGAALNQSPIDWENNKTNIIEAIENARREEIQLLCLPELSICGYGCEDLFLSKWVPEKCILLLLELKEYCKDITVSFGLPIWHNDKLYNCACLVKDTEILG